MRHVYFVRLAVSRGPQHVVAFTMSNAPRAHDVIVSLASRHSFTRTTSIVAVAVVPFIKLCLHAWTVCPPSFLCVFSIHQVLPLSRTMLVDHICESIRGCSRAPVNTHIRDNRCCSRRTYHEGFQTTWLVCPLAMSVRMVCICIPANTQKDKRRWGRCWIHEFRSSQKGSPQPP